MRTVGYYARHPDKNEEYKQRLRDKYANDPVYRKQRKNHAAKYDKLRYADPVQKEQSRRRSREWNKNHKWSTQSAEWRANRSAAHRRWRERNSAQLFAIQMRSEVERQTQKILEKRKCIEYLGGVCSCCGYSEHEAALEFHHRNPKEKSFTIAARLSRKNAFERVKSELDKCVLLCSNCHKIIEYELDEISRTNKQEGANIMPSKLDEWLAWAIGKKLFNPQTHVPHFADVDDVDEDRTIVMDGKEPVKIGNLVLTIKKK